MNDDTEAGIDPSPTDEDVRHPARRPLIQLLDYIEQVEKLKKDAPFKVPDEFFRAFQADLAGLPGQGRIADPQIDEAGAGHLDRRQQRIAGQGLDHR